MSKETSTPIFCVRKPRPNEGRKSFSIVRQLTEGGKVTRTKVELPELDRINSDLLSGVLKFENALALVKDLKERLTLEERGSQDKPITHEENLRLLDSYWKKDYQYRDLVDPARMRNDLLAALGVVGDMSLYTASPDDLYARIKEQKLSKNKQRRVILRINQLLKFAERKFTLRMPRQEFANVKYLNASEVETLALSLGGIDGDLVLAAFATGCRIGELFAITPDHVRANGIVKVAFQIRRDGSRALPKSRRDREIVPLPVGRDALKRWLEIPVGQRPRDRRYHRIVKDACKKLWPKEKSKHICFHDLRHSFAIEMLRLGESLTVIAGLLGNSIQVCQTYYTGFSLKSESLDALDARLKDKFKVEA